MLDTTILRESETEASVVAELAEAATQAEQLDPENINVRNGVVVDLEHFLEAPRRHKGTTRLLDDESFSRFVKEWGETSRIYADLYTFQFQAVFNDANADLTGWADHRAVLTLRQTPEWKHWSDANNRMMPQDEFAEHIEYGSEEVRVPTASDMLELATTFHAKTNVNFKQATVLQSGERRFAYEEDLQASAGGQGSMTIPKEFELGIKPFEGCDPYAITARLRFRLSGQKLSIGYKLIRPEDVQRAAFNDVVTRIDEATSILPLLGLPPEGV